VIAGTVIARTVPGGPDAAVALSASAPGDRIDGQPYLTITALQKAPFLVLAPDSR